MTRRPASSWGFDTVLFGLVSLTAVAATLSLLGALTIGIFIAPFAAALAALTYWFAGRRSGWTHALAGLLLAPALLLAVISTWIDGVRFDQQWCHPDGTCSNTDPTNPDAWNLPMFLSALGLALLAVICFVVCGTISRRRR